MDSNNKISKSYLRRLQQLSPDEVSRAIVHFSFVKSPQKTESRIGQNERLLLANQASKIAQDTFPQIDEVLSKNHGRRLSKAPNSLGTVIVEGPASAIVALAEVQNIEGIMEDQNIFRHQ